MKEEKVVFSKTSTKLLKWLKIFFNFNNRKISVSKGCVKKKQQKLTNTNYKYKYHANKLTPSYLWPQTYLSASGKTYLFGAYAF